MKSSPRRVAILLCAGYGTRMGALVEKTPKPLLPVGGRPVLDYLLDQIAGLEGLEAVHVVVSSRYAAAFEQWAAARTGTPPLRVFDNGTSSNEARRGAIGDLGFVLERTGVPEAALLAAGDNILRFSLRPLWRAFLDDGIDRVLALREESRERLRRTGVLVLDGGGRVVALHEKPEDPPSVWMCPPFYALGRAALERVAPYLASGAPADEIGRLIAHLARHQTLRAMTTVGERLDIGSPESYRRADEILRREPALLHPRHPEV